MVGHHHLRPTLVLVELELDVHQVRTFDLGHDRRQDFKPGAARLTGQDGGDRVHLLRVRLLVDKGDHGPVALVQGARPVIDHGKFQTAQADRIEVALADVHPEHSLASLEWAREPGGIARTGRRTVAVLEVLAFHPPRHRLSPPLHVTAHHGGR